MENDTSSTAASDLSEEILGFVISDEALEESAEGPRGWAAAQRGTIFPFCSLHRDGC